MSTLQRLIYALAFLLWCSATLAQIPNPSQADTRIMLLQGDFAQLDKRFGDIQRAYRAKEISEDDLSVAFEVFYDTDAALEDAYSGWVKHSPKSYAAHLARGIYYKKVGNKHRGSGTADLTTVKQNSAMRDVHQIASDELLASLRLDRKPLLSYANLVDVASWDGVQENARWAYRQSASVDPKSFIMRNKYLASLETQWGGSTEKMQAFVDQCRHDGFSQSQMAELNAMVAKNEGWTKTYRVVDLEAAAANYRRAALLEKPSQCAACTANYHLTRVLLMQDKYVEAIELASRVLRSFPDNADVLNMRGLGYRHLGKGPEAQADFLRAANQGDPYAQTELAKLLLTAELVSPDRPEAIKLLTLAAAQGYAEAIELLPKLRDCSADSASCVRGE